MNECVQKKPPAWGSVVRRSVSGVLQGRARDYPQEFVMTVKRCAVDQAAVDAWHRAKAMGWKAYVKIGLSDVLDVAACVAVHPSGKWARYAYWQEDINPDVTTVRFTKPGQLEKLLELAFSRRDAY